MRHHGSWYIKGLPGAAAVRSRFMRTATVAALARVLEDYLEVLSLGAFPDTP
jgi:tRNA-dihydrouridine synthase